ncbi:uncharacterized protein LOC133523979 isoform X2 [Cydia pomonella]|uniref:uncharacterized protein LOC133523979 isoform X2 n=1 Tax=Cydia pomonella TaxID=82600 RepID=UPI002ADD912C|nr:uncharacterized protein LOC133523979 isoform X2 [Cydia pomonella]
MADQEEDRLKNAGEALVVVDRQASSESRNKRSGQDGPSDGLHKRPKVPDIPSVAEKVKEDLEEKSHIISKPSEQNKVPKEIINQPAAKVQSTTSKAPAMKPFETIELTKIESGSTIPVIKQCPTMTLSTKKIDPNVEKRFETTFPAEMGSEPTVSEVTRRFEGTASKKELEPVVSGAVNRLKDKGSETIESVFTAKVKQSQPIAQEVKPMITKASLSLKKADEKLDVDSIPDDIVVLPTREETRLSVSQDWTTNIDTSQKREISWDDPEYLDKVQLQILSDTPSTSRAGMPYAKPCGIALCLPRRSQTPFNSTAKTGIHIEISKQFSTTPHCLSVIREKLDTIRDKIIHYFNK